MAVTPYQMPNLAAYNRPIADPNSQQKLRAYQDYVTGLLADPMARAEFGTGLLQGTTTDLAGAPADIYSGAVDLAQAVTPQNAPQNRFFMTNPFYMLSQSGDLAEQASSVAGSEALGEAVYGKPQEGYAKYRDPARIVGGLTGGGELLLGKASAKVAPYIGDAVNYLTDAMPRPQVATPEGLLMDAPKQTQAQPQTLLMEGDTVPSATQTVDNVPVAEPAQVVPPTDENPVGIIAFHGSGADFDEFKLERIGTGEGAQAYGYGLYFTDSEDIAQFYRNTVSKKGGRNITYDGKEVPRLKDMPETEQENIVNQILSDLADENQFFDQPIDVAYNRKKQRIADSTKEYEAKIDTGDADDLDLAMLSSLRRSQEALDQIDVNKFGRTGKIYKVGLEPKAEEFVDYDLPIGEQPEQIKVALIKALEDINDPELNANIMLEARAAKEKQEAVDSLNKNLDDFSNSLPNQESKETFAKLRELLIDKKHKWSSMVNRDDMEEERRLFEEFTKLVPPSKYPDIDPNIIYDIQRSLKIASPKSIGSFLPTDKKTADALSSAGIKGIKYRAAGSRGAGVDDVAAERNYVIFDDKLIKIMEKYGIPAGVSVTAVKGAMQDTNEGLLSKDQPQPQGLL